MFIALKFSATHGSVDNQVLGPGVQSLLTRRGGPPRSRATEAASRTGPPVDGPVPRKQHVRVDALDQVQGLQSLGPAAVEHGRQELRTLDAGRG